jgi:hypothetical protein
MAIDFPGNIIGITPSKSDGKAEPFFILGAKIYGSPIENGKKQGATADYSIDVFGRSRCAAWTPSHH